VLRDEGKLPEAESRLRDAVQRALRVNGEDHPTTLKTRAGLAAVLLAQGRLPEAEALSRDTLERLGRVRGKDHPDVAAIQLVLGKVLLARTSYLAAEEQLLGAEPALRRASAKPSPRVRECDEALALLYEKWDRAEPGKGYGSKATQWRDAVAALPR
jgi:hypothetical protein